MTISLLAMLLDEALTEAPMTATELSGWVFERIKDQLHSFVDAHKALLQLQTIISEAITDDHMVVDVSRRLKLKGS